MRKQTVKAMLLLLLALLPAAGAARAEAIRELVSVGGADPIPIEGFGIVTGLNNTGDKGTAALSTLRETMSQMDLNFDLNTLTSGSVALVRVRAEVAPFVRQGQQIPVSVTVVNGAKSLEGGELLRCNLRDANKEIVAQASGLIITGDSMPTRGAVPAGTGSGALVLVPHPGGPFDGRVINRDGMVRLNLKRPNWGDASTIARRINQTPFLNPNLQETTMFSDAAPTEPIAIPKDAGQVVVFVPRQYRTDLFTDYMKALLEVPVSVDRPAMIVVNRARNSIVVTGDIRVNNAMVSLQDKTVTVRPETPEEPASYTLEDGTPRTAVELEGPGSYADLQGLIDTLNAMGLTTDQVITIFEELRASGAISADFINQ